MKSYYLLHITLQVVIFRVKIMITIEMDIYGMNFPQT